MRKVKSLLVFLLTILLITSTAMSVGAEVQEENSQILVPIQNICTYTVNDDFYDNVVIVTIRHEHSGLDKEFDIENDFPEIFDEIESYEYLTYQLDPTVYYEYLNYDEYKQILKFTLKEHSKANVLECISKLERNPLVFRANPQPPDVEACSFVPNDEKYVQDQQALFESIGIPDAWDYTMGSSSVKVGVLDSGVYVHSDLVGKVVEGYDFYNNTTTTDDDHAGHGTICAGIIGAKTNNGTGIAGVAPNVTIVPLQITEPAGVDYGFSRIVRAINYAATNNIPIINLSFETFEHQIVMNAYYNAITNYTGLVVCAAGNDGEDIDTLPFDPTIVQLDNVIYVGASTTNVNVIHSGSNYGNESVDILAPGDGVPVIQYRYYPADDEYKGEYLNDGGTSIAAPFVAATAALLKSYNSTLNGYQMKQAILEGADVVPGLDTKIKGGKRLNVKKALEAVFPTSRSKNYRLDVNVSTNESIGYFTLDIEHSISRLRFNTCWSLNSEMYLNNLSHISTISLSQTEHVFKGTTTCVYYNNNYPVTTSGSIVSFFYDSPLVSGIQSNSCFDLDYSYFKNVSGTTVEPETTLVYALMGDTNSDGEIDSTDASRAMSGAFGSVTLTAEQKLAADVNYDGVITSADSLLISQYVNGSVNTFVDFD